MKGQCLQPVLTDLTFLQMISNTSYHQHFIIIPQLCGRKYYAAQTYWLFRSDTSQALLPATVSQVFFFSLLSTYDGKMYRNISLSLVHIMEFQYAPNQNHNPSRQNKKSAKNRGINCTFLKKRKKKGAFKEHQFLNFSPLWKELCGVGIWVYINVCWKREEEWRVERKEKTED